MTAVARSVGRSPSSIVRGSRTFDIPPIHRGVLFNGPNSAIGLLKKERLDEQKGGPDTRMVPYREYTYTTCFDVSLQVASLLLRESTSLFILYSQCVLVLVVWKYANVE